MLGLVLALALSAVLVACGSDKPPASPAREAATSTSMPGDAPTATDAPRPTATTDPLLAIGPTSAKTDREALVVLYNATDGPNWDRNENWLSDAPLGEWEDVETDDNGRVVRLYLEVNQLRGEIPPELGSLANLEYLALGFNQLRGEIPPELGSLANLEELWLYSNDLSGRIPPELGSLANLQWLVLGRNRLSGEIPPELGSLANLYELQLQENRLSGEIPPELGSLANLYELSLYETQLSGCAPAGLNRDGLDVFLPETVDGYCP